MTLVYRTDGAWGTGKGANLTPSEVDGNFYDVDGRISYIEDNPVAPIEPISIAISGSQFTMGLSNGDTLGPITITMPMPHWRGNWVASVHYNEMDFFTAPDGGFGAVLVPHNSVEPFDWARLDAGGKALYLELVGATGTTAGLGDLVNVALGTALDDDFLIYDLPSNLWVNRSKTAVATTVLPPFAGDHGAGATQGMVPAAAAGDAAAGKVLGAGGTWIIPTVGGSGSSSLAGLSDVAIVSPANLSLLQYSTLDGKWHNQTLATLGAGTVGTVNTGAGLTGGPITTSGTISLASVATLTLLANVTGGLAAPGPVTLTTLLDAALGTGRGMILRRGGTEWTALAPGTAGQYLATGGVGNDVTWQTAPGSGTVSQVNSGPGLIGGPITASGTLSLATIADSTVLGNVSGSTTTPTATSVTLLLDHALGATQGQILYRGATTWTVLAPGTAGQLLRTGGAGANPSWTAAAGSGTVTQVDTGTGLAGGPITTTGTVSLATIANQTLLANISGATAAPTPNSLSAIIDNVFGATRGSVLYRGASGWAALGPGTAGQALTTHGAGADPTWAAGGGGSTTTISDTPPGSPTVGSGWWDSVGGQLYLWYDDGTSAQWVPATNQTGLFSTPLSVANGGTGTTTAFTAGSIVFAGAGGAYAQDNAGLFYDDTNNRLGVGTATPGYRLDVNGSTNVSGALTLSTPLAVASGGTGAGALTAGSVVFAGASGVHSQDNANLFWDDGNNRLGVGTATPNALLSLNKLAPTLITAGSARTDAGMLLYDGGAANWAGMGADGSGNFWLRNGLSGAGNFLVMQAGGNVGIGVTGPNALLSLQHFAPANISSGAARTDATVLLYDNAAANWCGMGVDTFATFWLRTGTTASSFLVMTQGGYVGIGTASPAAMLEVNGTFRAIGAAAPASGVGTEVLYTGGAGYVQAYDRGGAAFRPLNVSGSGITFNGATTFAVFDATSTRNVSGAWATISDRSMKENVLPYTRGLDAIVALNPVQFRYIADSPFAREGGDQLIGLLADEVQPHVPEIVGETTATVGEKADVTISTLEPGLLVFALINSVKTIASTLDALSARIEALEARA